jgi:catechol 2,3-dioxygenase-like lactoylglutathione lyase family enzyme
MGQGLFVTAMRVARPVRDLAVALHYYVEIIGLEHLGGFAGHEGYDGAFVGTAASDWHLELTSHSSGLPRPSPTEEDLLVFYVTADRLRETAAKMAEAGFAPVHHPNPYWAKIEAAVYRDPDGYNVVFCREAGRAGQTA